MKFALLEKKIRSKFGFWFLWYSAALVAKFVCGVSILCSSVELVVPNVMPMVPMASAKIFPGACQVLLRYWIHPSWASDGLLEIWLAVLSKIKIHFGNSCHHRDGFIFFFTLFSSVLQKKLLLMSSVLGLSVGWLCLPQWPSFGYAHHPVSES